MSTILKNNRGNTEHDPCTFAICTAGDVGSWAVVLRGFRSKVKHYLPQVEDSALAAEAAAWVDRTEELDGLAGGVTSFWDFGLTPNEDLINQIIAEAKEGRRLLELMSEELDIPGGADVGADDGETSDGGDGVTKDLRLFVAGGAIALMAYAGWRVYKEGL